MTTQQIFDNFRNNYSPSAFPQDVEIPTIVQSAYTRVVNFKDWEYSSALTTVTSDTEGNITLPTDFRKLTTPTSGRGSSIWVKGDTTYSYPIRLIRKSNLQKYDTVSGGIYTLFYHDPVLNKLIFFNGQKRANTTFNMTYQRKAEDLAIESEPILIPTEYHELISLEIGTAYFMKTRIQEEDRGTYNLLLKNKREWMEQYTNYNNSLFDAR